MCVYQHDSRAAYSPVAGLRQVLPPLTYRAYAVTP